MTPTLFALLERVHGHLALLGLALLLHPIVSLMRRKGVPWWTQATADLAALLLAAPFGLGWWIYSDYRAHVKGGLYATKSPALPAFETKEHLAVFAMALAIAGTLTLRLAGKDPGGRRTALALLLSAWCCGVVTGVIGMWVSAVTTHAW
jgi:hypothetical protein